MPLIVIHWSQQLRFKIPDSYPVLLSMPTNWPLKLKQVTLKICILKPIHTHFLTFLDAMWFKPQWAAKLHIATYSLPHFRLQETMRMIKLRKLVSWDSLIGKAKSPRSRRNIRNSFTAPQQQASVHPSSGKTGLHHVFIVNWVKKIQRSPTFFIFP